MENNTMRELGFDWMFAGQNPTDFFTPAPSSSAFIQQPPPSPVNTFMGSSSPSMRSINNGFVFDNNNNLFPFMNKPNNQFGVNPIRSIHEFVDHQFDPYKMYCLNNNDHLNPYAFQETSPIGRNLDIDFSRLNISSYPNNRRVLPAAPRISNINGCYDVCCNPNPHNNNNRRDSLEFNGRFFDQNPSLISNGNSSSNSSLSRVSNKRSKFPSCLKDVRGKVYSVAKNQEGCQFLQMKCEVGNSDDIEMIFNEIKDYIRELMVDASMNYLAQKLFKVCNERQMTHIVVSVISDDASLTNICLNSHGTRAMQKLIECVTSAEQRSLIVSALRRITVTLTKNTNGHHVIQHCLKTFKVDQVQPILNVVADNCLDIATDKSGCCVLQQCVLHANGASKERLMTEIIDNSLHLAEHPYGNYVVQHLLGMQISEVTGNILQKLAGNIVTLALNKYASNVIEKCLKDVASDQTTPIIREILNSSRFLDVVQNPYGNYVVQSALLTAKGSIKEMMINRIQKDYVYLHSHPHGKRVLALARNSKPRGSTHV